jgi:hypothetical protein
MDEVNLDLTLHVEASCMWFINEVKLESMHASDQVQFQTKQASCTLIIDEIKSNVSMHSSDHVNFILILQVEANCMESN